VTGDDAEVEPRTRWCKGTGCTLLN